MGQQQLLLLVLGIVIVGLAVVGGIQAFGENQKKANQDLVVSEAVNLAGLLVAWKQSPGALGGGRDLSELGDRVDLARLGVQTNGTALCDYASGARAAHTRGDNCLITPNGEYHVARGHQSWMHPNGIGYIHAIARNGTRTYRVQIITNNGGSLFTRLDDIQNGRPALPMP